MGKQRKVGTGFGSGLEKDEKNNIKTGESGVNFTHFKVLFIKEGHCISGYIGNINIIMHE